MSDITGLSLYKIETELAQLIDLSEDLAAVEKPDAETLDARAAVHQQIMKYFEAEVRKVDGIARYIHHAKAQAAAAKTEADRLMGWARRWEARLERVKLATIEALHAVGSKKLESAENRLRLQKNPASVDVYDVTALPDEFLNVTVTIPLPAWKEILYAARNAGQSISDEAALWIENSKPISQADKRAVVDALKARVKCPSCGDWPKEFIETCNRCENKRTIPATVPGARWAPETEHLRCE